MIIAAATVEPARRTGDRLGATLAGLALAAVLHAVALFYIGHGFVDDSFIFFRYAENLASGHGFSWNVGEPPVEGHSSFLWLFLLAGIYRATGIELPTLAFWLGIAGSFTALLLTWRLARQCLSVRHQHLAVLAPITLAASPLLARHAINGLETSLAILFYLAVSLLWAATKIERPASAAILGIVTFIGLLIRPDSPAFSVPGSVLAILFAVRTHGVAVKHFAAFGISFASSVTAFLLWKLVIFGAVLPLPALIKFSPAQLYSDGPEFRRMLNLWLGFTGLLAPVGMLGIAGATMLRFKLPRATAPVVAGSLGYAAYLLTTVPIMNFDWRLHYPVLPPLLALSLALWCEGLSRYKAEIARSHAIAVVITISIIWLALDGASLANSTRNSAHQDLTMANRHEALGRALAEVPDLTVAYSEAGRLPFYSKAHFFDVAGINDRFIAEHRRIGDIDQVFERYLVEVVGLPDLIVRSPPAYQYASMERLPRLRGQYESSCFDGLLLYVRSDSPRYEAISAALKGALARTSKAPCQQ
jgi:arabinofuranosyltransferase